MLMLVVVEVEVAAEAEAAARVNWNPIAGMSSRRCSEMAQ